MNLRRTSTFVLNLIVFYAGGLFALYHGIQPEVPVVMRIVLGLISAISLFVMPVIMYQDRRA